MFLGVPITIRRYLKKIRWRSALQKKIGEWCDNVCEYLPSDPFKQISTSSGPQFSDSSRAGQHKLSGVQHYCHLAAAIGTPSCAAQHNFRRLLLVPSRDRSISDHHRCAVLVTERSWAYDCHRWLFRDSHYGIRLISMVICNLFKADQLKSQKDKFRRKKWLIFCARTRMMEGRYV